LTVFHSIPNTSQVVGITIAARGRFNEKTALMRIRVVQRPTQASVDGLRLDRFETGYTYDVSTSLGCLMLSEQWAEPVVSEDPALLVPIGGTNETKSSAEPRRPFSRRVAAKTSRLTRPLATTN
jgi:hypothetical protein